MEFVQNNLMLIAVAVTSGLMLIWPTLRGGSGSSVNPLQATQLINREDALVIDVREDQEYSAGHIANSRHVPLRQLSGRMGELEKLKERTLIVNCRSGQRSSSACAALRRAGFAKVYNLAGGIGAWEQAGLPITRK